MGLGGTCLLKRTGPLTTQSGNPKERKAVIDFAWSHESDAIVGDERGVATSQGPPVACTQPQRAKMRAKISWLLSATLLLGATAATAQSFSCASVAPEVRERVREAGACRAATPDDAAPKDAAPASSAVTVSLSDGTVVRVPREISANIRDGRQRAATSKTAARAGASTQSEPDATGDPAPALQKLKVPDVIGRSYADAGRALGEFKVDRIVTASAAPSGEVLAQEPAAATLMLPGSTVSLHVSDGSLASAAGTTPVTAPATASAASVTPLPATDSTATSAAAPVPASEPPVTPEPRGRFPIAFFANAVLILGAGVLLGLLCGALLVRQWLLRRKLAADENAAPPPPSRHQQRVETGAGGVSETGAAREIRFATRLDMGETMIEWGPLPDGDPVAIEHLSDHHA